jgi:Electron transfer DM13
VSLRVYPGFRTEPDGDRLFGYGGLLSLSGEFHPVAHPGKGDAIVYRSEDGSHVLRLENLDIFNGPTLYVYAVGAQDAKDSETVEEAGFLSLGPFKGNQGNQTYGLPARFDPEKHRSISIWCKRFSVNFATAPLR